MSNVIKQCYSSQCEDCGKQVQRHITLQAGKTLPPMKRIYCSNCRNIVRANPEDNQMELA